MEKTVIFPWEVIFISKGLTYYVMAMGSDWQGFACTFYEDDSMSRLDPTIFEKLVNG